MRLLLDTHMMLWWQGNHPSLPKAAIEMVNQAEAVYFSQASLWEMAIKVSLGKLRVDLPRFSAAVQEQGFLWLPTRNEHLLAVAGLPVFEDHRDPFDRLLVAQSLTEPLLLVTGDQKLARYGVTIRVV